MTNPVSGNASGLPSRRNLLLGIAAMPMMAAPALAVPLSPSPDARILELAAEVARTRTERDGTEDDDQGDALAEHEAVLLNEMAAETATTSEGLAAQAHALASIFPDREGPTAAHFGLDRPTSDMRLAWAIITGALKIAGAA